MRVMIYCIVNEMCVVWIFDLLLEFMDSIEFYICNVEVCILSLMLVVKLF